MRKDYFPYTFPIICPVNNVNYISIANYGFYDDINFQNFKNITFIYSREYIDMLDVPQLHSIDMLNEKIFLKEIGHTIIILNSYWKYFLDIEISIKSSKNPFNMVLYYLFYLEEILPQNRLHFLNSVTQKEGKAIVFACHQKVYHMFKFYNITPFALNYILCIKLEEVTNILALHNQTILNNIQDSHTINKDNNFMLHRLICIKKTRFLNTYNIFYFRHLQNTTTKKNLEELLNPINNTIFTKEFFESTYYKNYINKK